MLRIVIHVNRPPGQAQGIKEQIAMELERWGDVKVISIEEQLPGRPEQMQIYGFGSEYQPKREGGRR